MPTPSVLGPWGLRALPLPGVVLGPWGLRAPREGARLRSRAQMQKRLLDQSSRSRFLVEPSGIEPLTS
jgi:hypothetical protein